MIKLPVVVVRWRDACRADSCEFPKHFEDVLTPQYSCGFLLKKTKRCIAVLQNYALEPGESKHDYIVIPTGWVEHIEKIGEVEIPDRKL
ncbi:MAG TPA: hypothetical protein GX506_00985 [Firmicutes bacterium]|nr:hypothetical protein [Bacillota bacterium]